MKTFARLIRRYVLATAGIILVVVALLLGMTIYAGVRYNGASDSVQKVGALAEALHPTADGLQWDAAHIPAEWMHGYAWAMVLDEDGNVIWQQDLPEALNHRYTASDIAVFSRWYLADYPVQCWAADYGLFVAAEPVGSQWKYNITAPQARMEAMVGGLLPVAVLLLAVVLGCCLWFSWRGARHLQAVADGLDTLAQGGAVQLPTTGFAGELAEKLNETGEQLRRRNEIIARRDTARTDWIAGVSHDIRTPLALILGWGEQLQQDEALPAAARQKAAGICTQSEKIRSLIGDLNLTSKLQYGAQPLRRKAVTVGPFLRRCAAEFYESPAAGDSTLELELDPGGRTHGGAGGRSPAAAGHRKPFAQHCRPQCSPRACHHPGGCGGRHADHPGDRRRPGLPARRAGRIADWRNRGESPAHFRPACGRADPSRPRRHRRFCPSSAPRRGRCFDPAAVKTKRPLPENSDRGRAIYKLGAVG